MIIFSNPRLQWTSKKYNMPVVYYGTESGFYNRVRIVSEVFICTVKILALVDVTKLHRNHTMR